MVYILSAKRTPIGVFLNTFVTQSVVDLGVVAVKSVLEEAGVEPQQVQDVIMGQVLCAGAAVCVEVL